jgi:hypothetical protein
MISLSRRQFLAASAAAALMFHCICWGQETGSGTISKAGEISSPKPRVIISSDFPPLDVIPAKGCPGPAEKCSDPDDVQSMVRFLLYANEFEVEGLVASAGTFANVANKQNLLDILNVYDKVDENLRQHDPRYPPATQLRSITWQGRDGSWGTPSVGATTKPLNEILGDGKDSEASNAIIGVVDRPDPRPVWVCVWGGSREVAQAIWKVRTTRSSADLVRFLSRLRLYLVAKQDSTTQWLLDSFPDLFIILSEKNYMGMFWNMWGSDSTLADLAWINAHIRQEHGPLGGVYPQSGWDPAYPGQQEGDSPSFLHLVSAVRGVNDPEKPDQGGWGGKFVRPDPSANHWVDDPGGTQTVSSWRPQVQAEFAQRADWMLKPKLHVSGRSLQDPSGTSILLHGYMMAGASWFNGEGHLFTESSDYSHASNCSGKVDTYNGIADILSNPNPLYGYSHGWHCNFVRTAGYGTANGFAPGWDSTGNLSAPAQFYGWIQNVIVPWINHCRGIGLYVVICGGPSQTYPGGDTGKNMTQQFQQNLITYWEAVANYPGIKNVDNVMFEICNEPISIETRFGTNNWGISGDVYWAAHANFMQPIVDAIRNTGADNIILVPSLGWPSQCQGFASHPISGANVAYSGHFYPGYNNIHDNATAVRDFWSSNYEPLADQAPLVITEMQWDPNDGTGYQDLWNGSTEVFGNTVKSCFDSEGNVSYLIGMVGDLLANMNSGSLADTTLNTSWEGTVAAFECWAQYAQQASRSCRNHWSNWTRRENRSRLALMPF